MLLSVWRYYSTFAGVLLIAGSLTFTLVVGLRGDPNKPVVVITDFQLHTPVVPKGGSFTFSLWRKSNESCPGTSVVSFTPVDNPSTVVSIRYPYATPGFNSPPRLIITRELPTQVGPGRWRVQTGVDSRCPTRQRYDETSVFVLEVVDDLYR